MLGIEELVEPFIFAKGMIGYIDLLQRKWRSREELLISQDYIKAVKALRSIKIC